MSEIIFGTPEHVAGLSRKALEEDFQWVNDRRMELEGECERLDAENAKLRESVKRLMTQRDERLAKAEADNAELRELARQMYPKAKAFLQMGVRLGCNDTLSYDWYLQLRELGVAVDS